MEGGVRLRAGASKGDVREKVWDYLEASGLADFPRPVHRRIPNFKGASHAATKLLGLQEFKAAKTVKINPDAPQKNARFLTLEGSHQACCSIKELDVFNRAREIKVDPDKPLEGVRLAALQARKTLLVPTPRLRTGLFNKIVPPSGATKEILRICATSQGIKEYSVPVGLDGKARVDLVVVGSVAVSEKGWRIGKGEGYADMEYAMMVSMGAVQEDTPVVTIVHDCQVVDIAEELLDDHDLTVDYILTPTRTIKTNCKRPKPQGIIWHKTVPQRELYGIRPRGMGGICAALVAKGKCDLVAGLLLVLHPSCQHTFDQSVCLAVRLQSQEPETVAPRASVGCQKLLVTPVREEAVLKPGQLKPLREYAAKSSPWFVLERLGVPEIILSVPISLIPLIYKVVSYEMLGKIPILKSLRHREKQTGKDVTLLDEHSDLASANTPAVLNEKAMAENTRPQAAMGSAQIGQHYVESDSLSPRLEGSGMITTVYVGNIPPSIRVSELKCALREFHATPLRLNWQGAQHRAFLDYKDKATAESAVSSLKGLSLGGNTLRVELAKNQRNKGQVEINSHK